MYRSDINYIRCGGYFALQAPCHRWAACYRRSSPQCSGTD